MTSSYQRMMSSFSIILFGFYDSVIYCIFQVLDAAFSWFFCWIYVFKSAKVMHCRMEIQSTCSKLNNITTFQVFYLTNLILKLKYKKKLFNRYSCILTFNHQISILNRLKLKTKHYFVDIIWTCYFFRTVFLQFFNK